MTNENAENRKSVLITGASSGIGEALAIHYAALGYDVGIAARRMDRLKKLQEKLLSDNAGKNIRVLVQGLDVNALTDVAANMTSICEALGRVDIIYVNAGINRIQRVGTGKVHQDFAIVDTNISGAIATVDAAASYFKNQGHGQIVGISSLASFAAVPAQATYCASKAAFSMYLKGARLDLMSDNIDVTIITPGFIATEIADNIHKYPFVVSSEQGAKEIAHIVDKRKKEGIVPGYPWKYIKPFFGLIPTSLWKKLA